LRGFFAITALSAILLFSCNKEPDLIGLNIVPDGERLGANYMDTATIVAYTVYEDSVATTGMSYGLVGSIYDNVFGKTTASLYSQIKMTTNAPSFGTSPVVDSVVLVMPYYGLFGDSAALQTFRVYELSESLDADKKYYSNSNVAYDPGILLAEKTFLPRVKDSVVVNATTKVIPQLRLKFNTLFGEKILSDTANLEDNDKFVEFFKGIAITVASEENTPGHGSLVSFSLLSSSSYLKMYYHNTEDTLVYNFGITSASVRFNRYDHSGYDEASTELKSQLNGDTVQGAQKLFIQAFGGIKVKLRFPYLKKWAEDKKIAINDAQLTMTNADLTAPFNAPAKLSLRAIISDTLQEVLPDENEGSSYFDGTYNDFKGYRFRVSRYVQQLLIPESGNKGLYLFVPGASYVGNRLILYGTAATTGRMKLAIRYTRIK
jgi:hypothetical protein